MKWSRNYGVCVNGKPSLLLTLQIHFTFFCLEEGERREFKFQEEPLLETLSDIPN
jgi:hypothetical protein